MKTTNIVNYIKIIKKNLDKFTLYYNDYSM